MKNSKMHRTNWWMHKGGQCWDFFVVTCGIGQKNLIFKHSTCFLFLFNHKTWKTSKRMNLVTPGTHRLQQLLEQKKKKYLKEKKFHDENIYFKISKLAHKYISMKRENVLLTVRQGFNKISFIKPIKIVPSQIIIFFIGSIPNF